MKYKIRKIWDLENWAEINEIKIIGRVLADSLWPEAPDSFSPIEVLRTTARKKVKEAINFKTAHRLFSQLRLKYEDNFLDQ